MHLSGKAEAAWGNAQQELQRQSELLEKNMSSRRVVDNALSRRTGYQISRMCLRSIVLWVLLRNHSHIQDGMLWRSYSKKLLFAELGASSGMKLSLCLSRVVYIDDHLPNISLSTIEVYRDILTAHKSYCMTKICISPFVVASRVAFVVASTIYIGGCTAKKQIDQTDGTHAP